MKRDILRIDKHAVATGGTYDYVKSDVVPPGQVWVIKGWAYENETGARGTFRLIIEGATGNHFLTELQGPGAAELIFNRDEVRLREGEALSVRQASCTAADKLSLYADGYILFEDEEMPAL